VVLVGLALDNDVVPPLTNDNVHPNKQGAFELAQAAATVLTASKANQPLPAAN